MCAQQITNIGVVQIYHVYKHLDTDLVLPNFIAIEIPNLRKQLYSIAVHIFTNVQVFTFENFQYNRSFLH